MDRINKNQKLEKTEIMRELESFIALNGRGPSCRELARKLKCSGPAVNNHFRKMEYDGLIKRGTGGNWRKNRSIVVNV